MPTRYLKAEICDSETLDSLTPISEVLFYRLLVSVDDFGRLDARSSFVKSKCFPVRESITSKDVEKMLIELSLKNVLKLYEVEGRRYLQLSKWTNKPRSDVSKYPSMKKDYIQTHTDANECKANPPETVTVTVTETRSQANNNFIFPEVENRQLVEDWLKIRKLKKLPVTDTAIKGLMREIENSGWTIDEVLTKCCEKGWAGFEAKWVEKEIKPKLSGEFDMDEFLRSKL